MERKAMLIELIERGYRDELALLASLAEAERKAEGAPDCWSAKDNVAHVAEWKQRLADEIAGARRGDEPLPRAPFEQVNAELFELHRGDSWAEVQALSARAQESMLAELRALDEAQLECTDFLPRQFERALWRLLAGNGYIHPQTHLGQILVDRGDVYGLLRTAEESAARQLPLDDSPSWCGLIRYNLACTQALVGHDEQGLAELREAFALAPDLKAYAKEDTDLRSLWEDAQFQTLVAE